ncbi:MAG: hypothetical protein DWH79_11125 [Planctomycetota bacterium]|nr:MAG: hypothetical protein DWH79_11125 [Planctomycetota bacterium]
MLMPPALFLFLLAGWLERSWWGTRSQTDPAQIETRLARGPLVRTIDDAVTIERPADAPEHAPVDAGVTAVDLAASPEALALVRDDTVFRSGDEQAWFEIWQRLRQESDGNASPPRSRDVTFAQLFDQPRSFRGQRVRFAGTIRRLQEVQASANGQGIPSYWQAWIEPAGGPAAPIVTYFLFLPSGMATGMRVDVPVEIDGVYFKRWAYQASDAIRLAPLVMASAPRLPPRVTSGAGTSDVGGVALLSIAGLIGVTIIGLRLAAVSGRVGRKPGPERLEADWSGVVTESASDSLRRLSVPDVPFAPPRDRS